MDESNEEARGGARYPSAGGPEWSLPIAGFEAILASLREAVVAVDDRMRIVALNQAAVDLLAWEPEAAAGRQVCEIFGVGSCPTDCLEETLRTGKPVLDYQTTIGLAAGQVGEVLIRTAPLPGPDGKPLGAALILGDVTEITSLRKQVSGRLRLGRIIGKSRAMRRLFDLVEDVAASEASVLIRGESGTGKELVARALHLASGRADGPFVEVNCSALSESLLESELFGHVKGAFTGAISDRRGRFEEAGGGTLFLDEIGDISPVVQVKLLRVLQGRTIERVGDNRPVPVDVRLISATNRNLEDLLATGRLREDFYYRIKVVSLEVPPLKEREGDLPLLASFFLARLRGLPEPASAAEAGALLEELVEPGAIDLLLRHRWPGNVRELEHALEHAHVLSRQGRIGPEHLPPEIGRVRGETLREIPRHSGAEKEAIATALEAAGWNRTRAARRLGIDRTTLWRKIKEYGLRPSD